MVDDQDPSHQRFKTLSSYSTFDTSKRLKRATVTVTKLAQYFGEVSNVGCTTQNLLPPTTPKAIVLCYRKTINYALHLFHNRASSGPQRLAH